MIHVYTGNGKGKTTSAIGQIIRALGHKKRVCLIQLFKGKEYYGEQKILKNLKNLDFFSFAPHHPFCRRRIKKHDAARQCISALNLLKNILRKKPPYDLIVLDEFNIAIRDGFMKPEELIDAISEKNIKADIIITGRCAPKALIKIAELVTEMKEIKHPFQKGIKAKRGIEY